MGTSADAGEGVDVQREFHRRGSTRSERLVRVKNYESTTVPKPRATYAAQLGSILKATCLNRLEAESVGHLTLDVIEACRLPYKSTMSSSCDPYVKVSVNGYSKKGVPWPVGRQLRARTVAVANDRSPW